MPPGNRSLNLANAVAVVLYEAWRCDGFTGAGAEGPPGVGTPGPTLAETPASPPFDP